MQQFIEWLSTNPVWVVILAAVLANLRWIIGLIQVAGEKWLPAWFKHWSVREKIEREERGAMASTLAKFLDEEQAARTIEREKCTDKIIELTIENAGLVKQLFYVLDGNRKQNSSVISALMSVAESQRRSAERTDRLYELYDELATEVRQSLKLDQQA